MEEVVAQWKETGVSELVDMSKAVLLCPLKQKLTLRLVSDLYYMDGRVTDF